MSQRTMILSIMTQQNNTLKNNALQIVTNYPIMLSKEALLKGRLITVDLLIRTSLDQLLLILKISFTLFTKHATLIRRSTVLRHPLRLVFHVLGVMAPHRPKINQQMNFFTRKFLFSTQPWNLGPVLLKFLRP